MKRKIFIAFALCSLVVLNAVGQMKYCLSYDDFQEGNWVEMDTLAVKERSQANKFWTGGNEFSTQTDDDSLKNILKKEAFAILYHDTLLVNCRKLYYEECSFGKGYALAYVYGGNKLCFVNRNPANNGAVGAAAIGGIFFGAIGAGVLGGIAASSNLQKGFCFLVKHERRDGKVDVQMIDDKFMQRFEKDSPEFYAEYMSVKKKHQRESAAHVLPLLKEWSLIQ